MSCTGIDNVSNPKSLNDSSSRLPLPKSHGTFVCKCKVGIALRFHWIVAKMEPCTPHTEYLRRNCGMFREYTPQSSVHRCMSALGKCHHFNHTAVQPSIIIKPCYYYYQATNFPVCISISLLVY